MEIMNQLENLKKIAKTKLAKNDPAHDFEHVMRVYRNAEKICKTENGNKKLVLSAVLLHDIIKTKTRKDSSTKSAKLSEKILKLIMNKFAKFFSNYLKTKSSNA